MHKLISRLIIALAALVTVASSEAGTLTDRVISEGPNAGRRLSEVVSRTVAARAVEEAFIFFDRYENAVREYHYFPIVQDCHKPEIQSFGCGMAYSRKTSGPAFSNKRFIMIFDLNLSSNERRFHLINLRTGDVTSMRASHGTESACPNSMIEACNFVSNRPSRATPLGFFSTSAMYYGKNRYSITMHGLQSASSAFEGNFIPNTLIIHGAPYAEPSWIESHGYMGRSNGCVSMSYGDVAQWRNEMKDGALLYFFHNSLSRNLSPMHGLISQ